MNKLITGLVAILLSLGSALGLDWGLASPPPTLVSDAPANEAALTGLPPIVFVSRAHVDTLDGRHVGPPVEIVGREVVTEGRLLVLYPDDRLVDLTDGLPLADVSRPMVSFDAQRVVFAGVASPDDQWHIYEMGLDGSGFRQLTFDDRQITVPAGLPPRQVQRLKAYFGRYGDFAPAYLPDGRIIFSSTRYVSQSGSCGRRATNLYVMDGDGGNLHRVTTQRAGATDPYVLSDGRVLFSHWVDNMNVPALAGPGLRALETDFNFAPSFWILWAMHPDGSGAGRYAFNAGQFEDRGGLFQAREMPDGRIVYTYRANGSLLGDTLPTGIAILTPGMGQSNTVEGIGDPRQLEADHALGPAPLPDGRFLFSYTPSATVRRDLSGWATADFDYGLYLTDAQFSQPVLVYDNPGTDELDAVAAYPRPVPPVLPDLPDADLVTDDPAFDPGLTATLINHNVYADLPLDEVPILSPLVGSVVAVDFYDDSQTFTTSPQFPLIRKQMPRFLFSVPVQPDGSFRAEVPADRPIFWVLRSASGVAARYPISPEKPRGWDRVITPYVPTHDFFRPGQEARCTGCHRGHMIDADLAMHQAHTNLARLATASASSSADQWSHAAERVNDNWLAGPDRDAYEWGAARRDQAPWVQLDWPMPIEVDQIVLYPRAQGQGQVTAGTLTFSDGSRLAVDGWSEGGPRLTVPLPEPKTIEWVRLTIDRGDGISPGLAEMAVNGPSAVTFPDTPPPAPSDLQALGGYLFLTWDRVPAGNVGGYQVHYGTQPGQYTASLDVGNVSRFLLTGLEAGQTYYAAVRAYNVHGTESAVFSNEVNATIHTPVIERITPAGGPPAGGTEVTITGRGFAPRGVRIMFGRHRAYRVNVVNERTLTVLSPYAYGAEMVDVQVVNPDGQEAVMEGGFTYR